MESLLESAAQFGPLWLMAFVFIFLVWHFGTKYMEIYHEKVLAQTEIEKKREDRKSEETEARIQHDREMAEIKGQMAVTMQESNTLMMALKTLMESVVESNNALHEDLKRSQSGSQEMRSDVREIKQKIDTIFVKGVVS